MMKKETKTEKIEYLKEYLKLNKIGTVSGRVKELLWEGMANSSKYKPYLNEIKEFIVEEEYRKKRNPNHFQAGYSAVLKNGEVKIFSYTKLNYSSSRKTKDLTLKPLTMEEACRYHIKPQIDEFRSGFEKKFGSNGVPMEVHHDLPFNTLVEGWKMLYMNKFNFEIKKDLDGEVKFICEETIKSWQEYHFKNTKVRLKCLTFEEHRRIHRKENTGKQLPPSL
jgi:hypothetical protein